MRQGDHLVDQWAALGTLITLQHNAPNRAALFEQARRLVAQLDSLLSRFQPASDVTRLNQAGGGAVQVSPVTDTVLQAAWQAHQLTGGAFNAGPLIKQPGFGRWRLAQGGQLDLGGIAKGYVADQLRDLAVKCGARSVLVSIGSSSVSVSGDRPKSGPWRLGLGQPGAGRHLAFGVVLLQNGALSTSGNDERPGHIAAAQAEQVTVLAPDGMTAEVWSTALMVLGPAGLTEYWTPQANWQALLVSTQTVITTPGFPWQAGCGSLAD
ncbi:MAG: FAD:protein FMN transferase [Bifidobacteriaceae bacterium]|jgi:thiamine biosynthesis lipoprotein|nr:FAD:protein FMN transferase [Bifidobacteriaceae bacterium]